MLSLGSWIILIFHQSLFAWSSKLELSRKHCHALMLVPNTGLNSRIYHDNPSIQSCRTSSPSSSLLSPFLRRLFIISHAILYFQGKQLLDRSLHCPRSSSLGDDPHYCCSNIVIGTGDQLFHSSKSPLTTR
ncbi:hypothetical protein P5673_029552 [Acropora cervicornis]|uniref:Secreted protein n=1 Tax=Acropora cervicornis TaxID=6130 RepID=A0AAD9UUB0_ACRCE|nr:hypothetical protein P5673_029552 [Acropora cervicornis]